jgi:hypothetical protein
MNAEYHVIDQPNIKHMEVQQDRSAAQYFDNPFPEHDGRLLVWEFKRPLLDLNSAGVDEEGILAAISAHCDSSKMEQTQEMLVDNILLGKQC